MNDTTDLPNASNEMSYGLFITLVAKDQVITTFGSAVKDWPDNNFWALTSMYRTEISTKSIPGLMKQYGINQLREVPSDILEEYKNANPD